MADKTLLSRFHHGSCADANIYLVRDQLRSEDLAPEYLNYVRTVRKLGNYVAVRCETLHVEALLMVSRAPMWLGDTSYPSYLQIQQARDCCCTAITPRESCPITWT